MRPLSGLSSPRQSFRIVLLPEPATPRITLVSPRLSSKETPSRTGTSSKPMTTSSKMIALCTVSGFRSLLGRSFVRPLVLSSNGGMEASSGGIRSAQGDKELSKHGIDRQNNHRGPDYGLSGGASHTLRAAFGGHAEITTYGGDDEAKHQRLGQPGNYVVIVQGLVSGVPVLRAVKPQHGKRNDPSPDQPYKVGNDGEKKHHEDGGDHARRHQLFIWVSAQGAHGVNLFRNFHRAQFAGHAGRVAARHHQAGKHRSKFPHHGKRNQPSGKRERSELFQRLGGIQRQHNAGEHSGEHHNRQRPHADEVGLLDGVRHVKRFAK